MSNSTWKERILKLPYFIPEGFYKINPMGYRNRNSYAHNQLVHIGFEYLGSLKNWSTTAFSCTLCTYTSLAESPGVLLGHGGLSSRLPPGAVAWLRGSHREGLEVHQARPNSALHIDTSVSLESSRYAVLLLPMVLMGPTNPDNIGTFHFQLLLSSIISNGPVSFTHNPPLQFFPSDFRLDYEPWWVFVSEMLSVKSNTIRRH